MNSAVSAPTTPTVADAGKTARPAKTTVNKAAAMRTARKFEAVLLGQFTSIMFEGIKHDGMFGGGPAEGIYRNMLAQEYGKVLANSGGIGLADSVYREIINSQEAS